MPEGELRSPTIQPTGGGIGPTRGSGVGGGAQTAIDEHDLFLFASGVLLHRDYCCPRARELFLQEQWVLAELGRIPFLPRTLAEHAQQLKVKKLRDKLPRNLQGAKMDKFDFAAEVFANDEDPGEWIVQAIEPGEGRIFTIVFSGPDAEVLATEYAAAKYREFRRHELRRPPYRSHPSGAGDRSGASPTRGATLRLVK